MAKLVGYILMILGVIIVALPIFAKEIISKLSLQSYWIMIAGLVIIALGFVFMKPRKTKSKQSDEEVPIYHENKIVGYRRARK